MLSVLLSGNWLLLPEIHFGSGVGVGHTSPSETPRSFRVNTVSTLPLTSQPLTLQATAQPRLPHPGMNLTVLHLFIL